MSNPPIAGTWDALEDAAEMMNAAGLAYIIICGMDESTICRTRSNAASVEALEWLQAQGNFNIDQMAEEFE
jgi:hypothetical protein